MIKVLTAAHCLNSSTISKNLSLIIGNKVHKECEWLFEKIHKKFNGTIGVKDDFHNDIAIIGLLVKGEIDAELITLNNSKKISDLTNKHAYAFGKNNNQFPKFLIQHDNYGETMWQDKKFNKKFQISASPIDGKLEEGDSGNYFFHNILLIIIKSIIILRWRSCNKS